ncbi:hypothetical protein D088_850089 [Salmonella enterica subsp. houtenae serovar 16:z4,z32:-- str. RKS3027]|nr:hypothetical protein D088_850089 [Salmonella enterica subsp. houtenae serovar 16:z4,z32:-- str. RKS3027]
MVFSIFVTPASSVIGIFAKSHFTQGNKILYFLLTQIGFLLVQELLLIYCYY